jgi:hypothetical protein
VRIAADMPKIFARYLAPALDAHDGELACGS